MVISDGEDVNIEAKKVSEHQGDWGKSNEIKRAVYLALEKPWLSAKIIERSSNCLEKDTRCLN